MVDALERKDGKRPFRHEELMRGAAVILFMSDRGDKRGLSVAPADATDARAGRRAAAAPVTADQQAGREGFT